MSHIEVRKKWRLLTRLGATLILGFFLLLISLPNLIDLDNYRPQLLDYLQSQLAGEVSVAKLGLTFQHGPGLRVDGVRVFDKSRSQHIFVTTAIINFDLWHLFKRSLHLSCLTLVRPDVVLNLERGKSQIAAFLNSTKSVSDSKIVVVDPGLQNEVPHENGWLAALGTWQFDAEISGAEIEIVDGAVEFTDSCFGTSPITTSLKQLNASFLWHKTKSQTLLKLTAIALDKDGDGTVKIEGSLSNLKFPLEPGKMVLDCKINAANLNGSNYFPYYQEYVPMRFIGGRVDIDSNYKGSLLGLFRSKGQIVLHQAELDYQQVFKQKLKFDRFAVDYDFHLADSYNTIETRDCTINADGLIVRGYCLLHEARRGIDGTIEAKLSSSTFNPVTILPLLPWGIIPESVQSYTKHLQAQGNLAVENAYLKGDYRKIVRMVELEPPAGIIGGHLIGENLSFTATENWPAFMVESADLTLTTNLLEISNLNLSIRDTLTCESGAFSLQNIFHQVQMAFSGFLEVDLQGLNPYLESLFAEAVKSSPKRALPITFKQGSIAGELTFQGPLVQWHEMDWGGTFSGREISFVLSAIPWDVENGNVAFSLTSDQVQIESATFDCGSVPLTLLGTVPGPGFFLRAADSVAAGLNLTVRCSEFAPKDLDNLLANIYDIKGLDAGGSLLEVNVTASANDFSDLELAGTLGLDWRGIESSFTDKPVGSMKCEAEFNLDKVIIKQLDLICDQSEFNFQGCVCKGQEAVNYLVSGEISSPYLEVEDFLLKNKIVTEKVPTGVVGPESFVNELAVEVAAESLILDYDLKCVVDKLVLPALSGVKKSTAKSSWRNLYDFNLSLAGDLDGPLTIRDCSWKWGRERAQVGITGELQGFNSLQGDVEIVVSDLDIDSLIGFSGKVVSGSIGKESVGQLSEERVQAVLLEELTEVLEDDQVASFMTWKRELVRNNLSLKARVQRLRWQQMILDEIECDCLLSAAGINIERLVGKSFDGDFNVYAGWRFVDDSFMLESRLEDIELGTLSDYLKSPDRGFPMSGGDGSLTLDLYWHGASAKDWKESLDGELDFNFHNGRLKRFTLIANICSLLNLSQFAALHLPEFSVNKGVPYRELTYKGLVVGGLLEIDEFDMQGPAFNLYGSGTIDLLKDEVNLEVGVQPLQAVDKLLASIPVVGYIITGDNKTFVVIPMTVRGPFDDLKIETQTVIGVGKNISGMVQRFFKTPVRLLQMPGKLFDKMGADKKSDSGLEKAGSVR
ncbi:AsmA-like C-terminal domain-containing protein [bacterium]|nr:AsmA-like C-terminal domain-containing protein [bacterium]